MWVVVSENSSLHRSCRVHVKALVLPGSSSILEILMSTSFTCCGVMCLTSLLSLVWPWSCVLPTQRGEKCTGRVQRQTMNLTPQGEKNLSCTGNFFCILDNHINYWSLTSQTDRHVWVFGRLLKMQYNLCFSLSLCLINSETCLFLASSHTERRRVFIHHSSLLSLARLHRFSPMKMLKI